MYEERKINILNKLSHNHITTVSELSNLLGVSPATVRRDLTTMENSGLLTKTHGGAILNEDVSDSLNYKKKQTKNYELKLKIAKKAAELINDGDIVSINSSTITSLMPQFITAQNITIVTNSLNIAYEMQSHDNCNLIILGGTYISKAQTIEGATTVNQIKNMRYKKAFLGANGIDLNFGFSTASELEQSSKIATMEQSDQTIFLCEHTKFNRCSLHKICNLKDAYTLITDSLVEEEVVEPYKVDINVILAD